MSSKFIIRSFFFFFLLFSSFVFSQNDQENKKTLNNITLGAYYFDGWTGVYPYHITPDLVNLFPERESKWGWITSSQEIMNVQIDLAAKSGLSFFSFCWYYTGEQKYKNEPLNRSLGFYLKSSNINELKYNLLIVNYGGAVIGPEDWSIVCREWIGQFKSSSYLKVDGKPLLTFFSLSSLLQKFQTAEKVKEALSQLRSQAIETGLKGVSIAIVLGPNKKDIELAESCGFDILTGYNYHSSGFIANKKETPIDSMQKSELNIWNQFSKITRLPYIPVTTLNWDPRPWANTANKFATAPYFVGFSDKSVYNSVLACKKWIQGNPNYAVKEKIGIIYAWNEYGEGAYLTPTKVGSNPLDGVKKALKE